MGFTTEVSPWLNNTETFCNLSPLYSYNKKKYKYVNTQNANAIESCKIILHKRSEV